ncbi:MAG TPA: siderophore-iron reductase FhuF [Duganella sp.]|jgi:ferric iron reductase protein FhuF
MIPMLAPLFNGEWTAYGEALACAPQWPDGAIPVALLLQDADSRLLEAIRLYAGHLGVDGDDLKAVASAWSLDYLGALLRPAAAAASVLQYSFPLRAADVAVSLNSVGTPVRFHIRHLGGAMPGSAPAARYGPLLEEHLAPLFTVINRQSRVPLRILWGNAARHLDAILGQALALTGHAAHVAMDRELLLQRPAWDDGRANPLHGRQRRSMLADGGGATVITLHRQCCLLYRLPGESWCGACPLAPQHRKAR